MDIYKNFEEVLFEYYYKESKRLNMELGQNQSTYT